MTYNSATPLFLEQISSRVFNTIRTLLIPTKKSLDAVNKHTSRIVSNNQQNESFDAYIDMSLKTSRADFEAVWPSLVKDISEDAQKYNLPPNALEWFQKVGNPLLTTGTM